MDRVVYTATMSRYATKAAEYILAERPSNSGRVDLKEVLGLMTSPRGSETFIKVFANWHRMFVDSANTSAGKLMSTAITNEPPFVVAGQLNEFSRAVTVIVDTANTLVDAANIIQDTGHFKGGIGNLTCGFCIAGAIELSLKRRLSTRKTSHKYCELIWDSALHAVSDYLHTSLITEWNDDPNTTASDVVNTLRWAASDMVTVRF